VKYKMTGKSFQRLDAVRGDVDPCPIIAPSSGAEPRRFRLRARPYDISLRCASAPDFPEPLLNLRGVHLYLFSNS
jgi:hypothetical protein